MTTVSFGGAAVGGEEYDNIVANIYRAIDDPTHWQDVLAAISTKFGADSAFLYSQGLRQDDGGLSVVRNIDRSAIGLCENYYGKKGPWTGACIVKGLSNGRGFLSQELMPQNKLRKTEHYNDFDVPTGIEHGLVSVRHVAWDGLTGFIHFSLFRRRGREEFDQHRLGEFDRFGRHIRQALMLNSIVKDRARARTARMLVQVIGDPAILLDRHLRVVAANQPAEPILKKGIFLRIARGRLEQTSASTALLALLVRTLRSECVGPATIAAANARHSVGCVYNTMPISLDRPDGEEKCDHVLVVLRIGNRSPSVAWHSLRTAYGLTAAEARITASLVEGLRIEEIADAHAITRETARTHVKRILQKCDCRRQTELVRLVLSLFVTKASLIG